MRQLKLGDTFDSFSEWKTAFDEFCKATDQAYKVYTSKSVKSYNKKVEQSRLKSKSKTPTSEALDEKWQFAYVQYCCVLSRGKNKPRDEANGKVAYKKCNAAVGIKYTKQMDKLVIIKMNLEHNHSDQPDQPDDACDDAADLDADAGNEADSSSTSDSEEDEDPVNFGVSEEYRALSVRHAHGLQLSLGDMTDSELAPLLHELEKLEESDPDAAASVIVSNSNAITAVFFQTGAMRRAFREFPEVLLFDAGYTFSMGQYSLVCFSGHDASGLGCPFAFAILTKPVRLVAGLLLSVFVNANPLVSEVRVLLVGKEQLRLRSIVHFFDKACTTLLCHFHVIRSLFNKMDRLKMATADQERICRILRAMLACLHERTYTDNLKRVEQMDQPFWRHFRKTWHSRRDLWAGFCRNGIAPWCSGVNDRVEALVQFMLAVCTQARNLHEAVCNLAYGTQPILAQISTDAMLDEVREYHVKLLDYEAQIIAACCNYAAIHVLVQLRISRSHKFSVVATDCGYVVSCITGKATVPLNGFTCNCVFREAYGLPCAHAFVVAHARGVPISVEEVGQRWRRNGPFPIDLARCDADTEDNDVDDCKQGMLEYQDRLAKVKQLADKLTALVAVSPAEDFGHMFGALSEMYRTWSQSSSNRVNVSVFRPDKDHDHLVKDELLDTMDDFDFSHKEATDISAGLDDSHAVLSDDDVEMTHDGMKNNVFARTDLEKREESCSNPVSSESRPMVSIKMPDDAVFGFSGGIFKGTNEATRGQHVGEVPGHSRDSEAGRMAADKLDDDDYGLNANDLSCFTTSIGAGVPTEGFTAAEESDLFGYGAGEFEKELHGGAREDGGSPVLLSIKDDELSNGDNEESYKLLDSIMEAEASEKLADAMINRGVSSVRSIPPTDDMGSPLLQGIKDNEGLGDPAT
ncbi:uncharacterized protein LOC135366812 isoform X2 [Ornithodoros turicata]|uniref:uncharacterized protein LOC135366812 isoform X2 n=1 Tax=Ornithodoros turicata TaxID=34597 RepID=UPI00313A0781